MSSKDQEALRWVVWLQTARSIDRDLPAFERWLSRPGNRGAYLRARQEWLRWDVLRKDPRELQRQLAAIEARKKARTQLLWVLLALLILLVA